MVFDAIYDERNLTRAAEVLFVTQPAVSNALKRLRQVFDDPLFIRTPHGVTPTPVADSIAKPVREALHLLNLSLTEGQVFDPSRSEKTFRLSVHDYGEATLVPRLTEQLARLAQGISLECYPVERSNLEHELASGMLDFALDIPVFSAPRLCRQQFSSERYVCMLRPGHPLGEAALTLERYLQLEHVHVSGRRKGVGHVDRALETLGLERTIRLRMKNYMAAPLVVASSDLALTLPANLAALYELNLYEVPFNVEQLNQFLYWHRNSDQDQASIWMRTLLLDLLG